MVYAVVLGSIESERPMFALLLASSYEAHMSSSEAESIESELHWMCFVLSMHLADGLWLLSLSRSVVLERANAS
jgi:hypothetical protein